MNSISILIVEDELLIAYSLSQKLKRLGYNVIGTASSGEEALNICAEQTPTLVLMDIVIQGEIDGIETAKTIYKSYHIPVIYLTAYADEKTLMRAEHSNSYGYILKPFKERELHATIKIAIKKHHKQIELLKALEMTRQMSKKLQDIISGTILNINDSEEKLLENDLVFALQEEQLQVYYQPLVKLKNRQIIGAEALLRWKHPIHGFISPSVFIPIAEKNGLINPISNWMFKKTCERFKSWQKNYSPPLSISVNLSPYQFKNEGLVNDIEQIIGQSQISPELVKLELTESLLMDNSVSISQTIKQLKSLSVQLAIDDFGTGYSNLEYLQKFPFDVIKIDKCFIHNILHNQDKVSLTKAIIQIGHSLNLEIIAEGVESEAEIEFLIENKCEIGQGYLFSPALPVDKFEKLLFSQKI